MKPLSNDDWGFASNCFVCEHRNDAGLRIPFQHDVEAQRVVAEFELDDRFSGTPSYVHGGVVLAILDEAMAWATIAIGGRFAVTTQTTTTFERPVRVGRPYSVSTRLVASDRFTLETAAEVTSRSSGRRCAVAHATFTGLDAQQAADAAGAPISAENSRFIRSAANTPTTPVETPGTA